MHIYVHGHNEVEYCIDGKFSEELNVAVWPFMTKPASINLPIFFAHADSRQSAKFNSHKFSGMRYVVITLGTYILYIGNCNT